MFDGPEIVGAAMVDSIKRSGRTARGRVRERDGVADACVGGRGCAAEGCAARRGLKEVVVVGDRVIGTRCALRAS